MAIDCSSPSAVDERIDRLEALLAADLDHLGPAVLSEAVDGLKDRLDALARRLDAMVSVATIVADRPTAQLAVPAAPAVEELDVRTADVTRAVTRLGRRVAGVEQKLELLLGQVDDLSRRLG